VPRLVTLTIWALSLAPGCTADPPPPPLASASTRPGALSPNASVESVVDGDTIDVAVGSRTERVRLIGIDTPEIAHPSGAGRAATLAECFGDAAAAYTKQLLPAGTPVRLARDVVARDDYGRLLAYVFRASDGVLINYELARQGYAQALTIAPNARFAARIVEATRLAETDGAGLWGACRGRQGEGARVPQ
jgi:micrococcal nuclease